MGHPDSNFQIGQMRHREYETEAGEVKSPVRSQKMMWRLTTVVGGALVAALFVVQMIAF